MHFLTTGGEFGLGTPVHNMHVGTKPQRGTCGIHRHVAASNHTDLLSCMDGGEIIFPPGLHEVVAGEELVG